MSTVAASNAAPGQEPFRPGLLARAIAWFSGGVGLSLKIAFLCLSNALGVWAAYVLLDRGHWVSLASVVVATLVIDLVYLTPRQWATPAKFLIPGTVFLIAFQIIPIIYTIT